MNCYEIKKLLEIKRYDELTKEELNDINLYIRQCNGCSKSLDASIEYDKMLLKMKKSVPQINDPESLTRAIIDSTLDVNAIKRSITFIDKIFDLIEVPPVQYALKTLLVLITCFYIFEEFLITQKTSELENKYYSQAVSSAGINSIIENEILLLNKLKDVYEIVNSEKDYLELSDEWVLIRNSEQKRIIGYYLSYLLKDKYDEKELIEKLEHLDKINFLDGINEKEIKELDKHREIIRNEIKQILPER